MKQSGWMNTNQTKNQITRRCSVYSEIGVFFFFILGASSVKLNNSKEVLLSIRQLEAAIFEEYSELMGM